jgi:hypothetical protein
MRTLTMLSVIVLALTTFVVTANDSEAQPTPRILQGDLEKMIAKSDLLCVGKAEKVHMIITPFGTGDAPYRRESTAYVRILRTYKGKRHSDVVCISYCAPYNWLREGHCYLLFLKEPGDDSSPYVFASRYHGAMPASCKQPDIEPDLSTAEAVKAELRYALESGELDSYALQLVLMILTKLKDRKSITQAKALSDSNSLAVRVEALSLRLKLGDATAFQPALTVLRDKKNPLDEGQHAGLCWAIEASGPVLEIFEINKLMVDEDHWLRRVAASMLMQRPDKSSIPFLVKGLEDLRIDTQSDSFTALCRVTGFPGPGSTKFTENRAYYIGHIQQWLREKGYDVSIILPKEPEKAIQQPQGQEDLLSKESRTSYYE